MHSLSGKDKTTSDHHIVPEARGGERRDNIVRLDNGVHVAWHALFQDLLPEEAVRCIIFFSLQRSRMSGKALNHLRDQIKAGKVQVPAIDEEQVIQLSFLPKHCISAWQKFFGRITTIAGCRALIEAVMVPDEIFVLRRFKRVREQIRRGVYIPPQRRRRAA